MIYFVDTSFFVALDNSKDVNHNQAIQLLQEIAESNSKLYTCDFVIDEFLLILQRYNSMQQAVSWCDIFQSQEFCNVMYSSSNHFSKAISLFRMEINERKPLSFTDCMVLVCANSIGAHKILTFDQRLLNYKLNN